MTAPYSEKLMLAHYGAPFEKYKENVPMIFPNIWLMFKKLFKGDS